MPLTGLIHEATTGDGSGGDAVRVAIIEDHKMVAEGLVMGLAAAGDIEVAGVARTVAAGRDLVERCRPDVVLLDQRLPDGEGIALAAELRSRPDGPAIVMVTSLADGGLARQALACGCAGFVVKHEGIEEVRRAIGAASRGETFVSSSVLGALLPGNEPAPGEHRLTHRELEVLQFLADGAGTADIARRMFVSVNTVRNHVQNVLVKLGAHSKLEAVAIATRSGLVHRG